MRVEGNSVNVSGFHFSIGTNSQRPGGIAAAREFNLKHPPQQWAVGGCGNSLTLPPERNFLGERCLTGPSIIFKDFQYYSTGFAQTNDFAP